MSKEALDFLMGAGVPTASFKGPIGTKHVGTILNFEKRQSRDMDTGAKEFWDDGDPKWEIVFTLDTGIIDPEIDGDDGVRKLYAKGQMLNAIREAVKVTGHRGDLIGGKLGVVYSADGEQKRRGFNPPKLYKAKFEPPTEVDALGDPEPEPSMNGHADDDLDEGPW